MCRTNGAVGQEDGRIGNDRIPRAEVLTSQPLSTSAVEVERNMEKPERMEICDGTNC